MQLNFSSDMPKWLEDRLCDYYGYYRYSVQNKTISFRRKMVIPSGKCTPEKADVLSLDKANRISERCERVVSIFPAPEAVAGLVRTRLTNLANVMPTSIEAAFVRQWMDDNYPISMVN
jgi:hypothetical protein